MSQLFKYKNKQRGFTLTEILIVVLIVSVLSAIAYPIYTKSATKSRAVEAINLLEMVRNKQLFKYAHDKTYYTDVTSLGQITSNKKQESISEQELKVKDYTISLNAAKNCATAAYEKGTTKFSFSSGYENTGLGCTGDICTSFGNIIGGASSVCNCNGAPACNPGFTRNQNTCACECNLCLISGTCVAPTQTQPTSRSCGNNGTQVRSCTASCDGGACGAWGACTGQTCPASSKPVSSESCGNCGTHTRTVTCDGNTGTWTTTAWGSCTGEGVCAPNTTQSCGSGGTQTCTSSCQWSATCVEPACPASCSDGYSRTSATAGNFATCCTCPSPKTTKVQSGGCDVNGNCQADRIICTCPNSADYTKCTTTSGTWVDSSCSCNCPTTGKNPFDSTTGCACPANKSWLNWRFTSGYGAGPAAKQCICSNAIDYNANAGGACTNTSVGNDMEAKCKGLFCQPSDCSLSTGCRFLTASEALSYASIKFDAERTAAGTWNATTCSCTCPAGGTLTNGRCYMCTSPLVWNGSACACQLNCAQGYGTLDNYGYNTNAVRAATGCSCVCQTGQTWDNHGVTNLGQPVKTCAATCTGSATQTCGKCGSQTRVCNTTTGQWGSWGTCTGETGTCTPGATQSCNGSGTQTCTSSCTWGQCSNYCDDSNVPVRTQTCGTCGRQYRVVSCNTTTGQWTTSAWIDCMECPTGYYAAVSGTVIACQQCTNAPANASYSGCSRESTCGWTCNSGYTQSGNTCVVASCPESTKPAATQSCGNCNTGTQTRTVTCVSGSWTTGSWGTCSGATGCTPGATQTCNTNGSQTCSTSCAWGTCACPAGSSYNSAVSRCCTATENGLDTRDGGCCVELSSCGSGGVCRCLRDSPTPLECSGASSQTCGNCGTQTRVCNTSTGQWGPWDTCTGTGVCAPGATKTCGNSGTQTCTSSCAWGTACTGQTCPAATKPAEDEDCGPCGLGYRLRTVTCDTNTGNWVVGDWGQCGAEGCTPGTTVTCGGGNGKQTCDSSCFWSGCVCNSGYTWSGGTCALPTITPVVRSTSVVTSCNSVGGGSCLSYTYTLCQPGSGGWGWPSGFNSDDCRSRTSQPVCYNDYIQGGTASQFSCSTWSLSSCSGSNYQSICNANGKGYKCKISASGGTGNAATACMCEWYAYNSYSGYCDAASGLSCVTIYFDGEGSGSYLSCE